MTKHEIIERMARERMVEELVFKIRVEEEQDKKDLCEDIYVNLLEKDEEKIQHLWKTKAMKYFLVRMIGNMIYSKTSPYYTKYKKFRQLSEEISSDIKDRYEDRT